jgi:hypothetical protein
MTIHIVENDNRGDKFADLKKLSAELYVPVPEVFVRRKIENPGCETVIKDGRSHTWVRNYYNLIFTHCSGIKDYTSATYGAGDLNFKAGNGTVYGSSGAMRQTLPSIVATTSTDTAGILIGTSNSAYSFEDAALGAKIANGNDSGKMSYQAQAYQTPVYTSGTKEWAQTIIRVFNNNSGGNIGVNELAYTWFFSAISREVLLSRDVLSTTDTINNGGQYTVTYTVKMTFPE